MWVLIDAPGNLTWRRWGGYIHSLPLAQVLAFTLVSSEGWGADGVVPVGIAPAASSARFFSRGQCPSPALDNSSHIFQRSRFTFVLPTQRRRS